MCLEYTAYGEMAAATTEEGFLQIATITTLFNSCSTIISDNKALDNYRNNFVKIFPNLMINIHHT